MEKEGEIKMKEPKRKDINNYIKNNYTGGIVYAYGDDSQEECIYTGQTKSPETGRPTVHTNPNTDEYKPEAKLENLVILEWGIRKEDLNYQEARAIKGYAPKLNEKNPMSEDPRILAIPKGSFSLKGYPKIYDIVKAEINKSSNNEILSNVYGFVGQLEKEGELLYDVVIGRDKNKWELKLYKDLAHAHITLEYFNDQTVNIKYHLEGKNMEDDILQTYVEIFDDYDYEFLVLHVDKNNEPVSTTDNDGKTTIKYNQSYNVKDDSLAENVLKELILLGNHVYQSKN